MTNCRKNPNCCWPDGHKGKCEPVEDPIKRKKLRDVNRRREEAMPGYKEKLKDWLS